MQLKTNDMEILKKTLDQMPQEFSSNKFAIQAEKNGLSKIEVRMGRCAAFLHNFANRGSSKRMWNKKNKIENLPFFANASNIEIANAIYLLKQNGYKILEPVRDYREI